MLTAQVLLVVALIFGGGGSGAGLANLTVQLVGLAALALHRDAFFSFFRQAPPSLAVLVALTLLLPLLQCIPLPATVWHQLPGRDLASQSLALVGRQDDWMPLSLQVRRTFIAFLSLIPALTIVILTWQSNDSDRRSLLAVLVACGVLEVILGAQQLALGNRHLILYAEALATEDLQGTFANRNTTGLFLDITLCGLVGLLWYGRHNIVSLGANCGIAVLLAVGVFLTRSRSSMILGLVPLTMLLAYLWGLRAQIALNRARITALIAVMTVVAISVSALAINARIQHSLSRFDTFQDARPAIWQDAKASASRFWPVGSGIGTFDEVFQVDESLENLGPGRAARAHNEFLETIIESGIIAPVLITAWAIAIILAAWPRIRPVVGCGPAVSALAIFALLAFQSVLDYPLRSQAMLCVAGLALAFLAARRPVDVPVGREGMIQLAIGGTDPQT